MYYGDERYGRSFSIGQLLGVVGAAFVIASVFMNLVLFRFQGMGSMWGTLDDMLGTGGALIDEVSGDTSDTSDLVLAGAAGLDLGGSASDVLNVSYGLSMFQSKQVGDSMIEDGGLFIKDMDEVDEAYDEFKYMVSQDEMFSFLVDASGLYESYFEPLLYVCHVHNYLVFLPWILLAAGTACVILILCGKRLPTLIVSAVSVVAVAGLVAFDTGIFGIAGMGFWFLVGGAVLGLIGAILETPRGGDDRV
ncbi:MAG: hypothetical protein K5897_08025 [Eubacterium sp.]|nr:hypothetical protein [Eubacterium sp.]